MGCGRGQPNPLGTVWRSNGSINFAIFSKSATDVSLCLYNPGSTQPSVSHLYHERFGKVLKGINIVGRNLEFFSNFNI